MEYKISYSGNAERTQRVEESEDKGWIMLHDDFDLDWKPGDEPHGVMLFTDVIPPEEPTIPARDIFAELDDLKARVKKLEEK